MKIFYCLNSLKIRGGLERVLCQKINYMVEKFGYDITLILTDQEENPYSYSLNSKINIINLKINYFENCDKKYIFRHFFNIKRYIKHLVKLKNIINKEKPDILVSLGYEEHILIPFLKKKDLLLIREFHIGKQKRFFLFNSFNKFFEKKLDIKIVLTNEDKANRKSNCIVINNPLPFDSKEVSTCKNKKIISIGRLDEQKGFDILIDVWRKVNEKHPDWILEIYGEGSLRKELQDKIDSLNLTDTLTLKGNEKNIQLKYLESSIYVMSSRYEGMPMVLLEAMSCGLPLVSFDCPCGPKDIIKDGENGFLVKFGNIDEMAKKINYLIENEDKRIEIGKKSKELSYNYSEDKIMNQWKELFENLINRS